MKTGGKNKKLKILITGASGQLGKKIIELFDKKYQLILTDIQNMDITNILQVKNTIIKEKPDFIIHSAAYTQVDKAEENKDICKKINTFGTKNIAVIASKFNIPLIYISTDFVFDGKKNTPYNEKDVPKPISIYGQTKYAGEKFIQKFCKKYYIIRTSWLFGELPKDYPGTNFVEVMLKLAKEKKELKVVNDQIGSPTYTGDLVKIIFKMITQKPTYGIYHFSGKGACSWYDFAKEIFAQTKTRINLTPIKSVNYPQKAPRPAYSYLDKRKIEKALNIKPRRWQKMIKSFLSNKYDF